MEGPRPTTVGKPQEQLLLTCLAQGSPRPTIRWFKWAPAGEGRPAGEWAELVQQQQQQPANYSQNQVVIKSANETQQQQQQRYLLSSENNFLLIKSLQLADERARFKCLANNSFGAHQLETELRIERWPPARLLELRPRLEFISAAHPEPADGAGGGSGGNSSSSGATAASSARQLVLNCTVRASAGQPIQALEWLKNGRQLFSISLAAGLAGPGPGSNPAEPSIQSGLGGPRAEPASLFDGPNQELAVLEQVWANGAPGQWHESPEAQAAAELLDVFGQDQQQQQLPEQALLVASSTLAKLSGEPRSSSRLAQSLRPLDREQLLYQLMIREPLRRSDRGSYQCRARTAKQAVLHQTSQLLLRDTPPRFVDTFVGQLLAGGQQPAERGVSLKCVASGSPLPEISWTLSGFQVPESSRFRVGDYVTRDGLIVSFVNISQVQAEGKSTSRERPLRASGSESRPPGPHQLTGHAHFSRLDGRHPPFRARRRPVRVRRLQRPGPVAPRRLAQRDGPRPGPAHAQRERHRGRLAGAHVPGWRLAHRPGELVQERHQVAREPPPEGVPERHAAGGRLERAARWRPVLLPGALGGGARRPVRLEPGPRDHQE